MPKIFSGDTFGQFRGNLRINLLEAQTYIPSWVIYSGFRISLHSLVDLYGVVDEE